MDGRTDGRTDRQTDRQINGLVTNENTKSCCQAFISALFHSNTANKIDSEHIQDYKKLLSVCKVEILQVTGQKLKFSYL